MGGVRGGFVQGLVGLEKERWVRERRQEVGFQRLGWVRDELGGGFAEGRVDKGMIKDVGLQ